MGRFGEIGEELRIAGGDHPVGEEPAGVAVIGVQPVPAPRIVSEDHVGAHPPDHLAHLAALDDPRFELAVGPVEEVDLTTLAGSAGQHPGRLALLPVSALHQRREVVIGRPRPLRSVGEYQMVDAAAPGGPLGQCRPASELHVVGMGGDGERHPRNREIDADDAVRREVTDGQDVGAAGPVDHRCQSRAVGTNSAGMSDGTSTSHARSGCRTTRYVSPRSSAWARCRRKDPGP